MKMSVKLSNFVPKVVHNLKSKKMKIVTNQWFRDNQK